MNKVNLYNKDYYILTISLAVLYFLSGKFSITFLHGNNIVNIGVFLAEGISLAFAIYF